MPTPPAPSTSPFCQSISAVSFTAEDHEALLVFRRKLRRNAIWVVLSLAHPEFPEVVEVYRPYEVPGQVTPSWTLWRSLAGVWVADSAIGPIGSPTSFGEALAIVEAILKAEKRKAIRAIPCITRLRLP